MAIIYSGENYNRRLGKFIREISKEERRKIERRRIQLKVGHVLLNDRKVGRIYLIQQKCFEDLSITDEKIEKINNDLNAAIFRAASNGTV